MFFTKNVQAQLSNRNVLIIYDELSANTTILKTSLENAGFTVVLSDVPETLWNGANPSLTNFNCVIHLNGSTYGSPMPQAGQAALVDFVNSGNTYIGSEWNAFEIDAHATMRDLILVDRTSGRNGNITYTQAGISHPVLDGIPASFTFRAGGNVGPAHVFSVQPVTVLMKDDGNSDAVVIRNFGAGKVVYFNHAGNYEQSGPFNTFSDTNIQHLYINSVRWGSAGTSTGTTRIDSFLPVVATEGTTVTISGFNFTGATDVNFGGVPASSFTVVNDSTLTAAVSGGATGFVSVTSVTGTATLYGFSFVSLAVGLIDTNACNGSTLNIPFEVTGSFYSGNVFTAELSDSAGSFSSTTIIGAVQSSTSGIISAIIPAGQVPGNGYRIRIVSSSPSIISPDNGSGITINGSPVCSIAGNSPICQGTFTQLCAATGAFTYSWSTGETSQCISAGDSIPYAVTITNSTGCSSTCNKSIAITPIPSIIIDASPTAVICPGAKITFRATYFNGGSNPVFQWLKNHAPINGANTNSYLDSTLNDSDTIECVMASNAVTCGAPAIVTSNQVIMIVSTLSSDLLTTATPDSICTGGSAQLFSGVNTQNFSVAAIPYSNIPVPADAPSGPSGDDAIGGPYPLPFSFDFFGNTYTSFFISTNGNIQFGPVTSTSYTPGPLPNNTVTNFVAVCWADVIVPSNGIRYFVVGTAPRRKMIIDYSNCNFYGGGGTNTFSGQIWLYETLGVVETHLGKSIGFATSSPVKTVGVNNLNGSIGAAAPDRNGTAWETAVPEAWRFTPGQNFTFLWSPSASLNDSTLERPTATPDTTTEYQVLVQNNSSGCLGHGRATVTIVAPSTPAITIAETTGSNPTCIDRAITFKAAVVNQGAAPLFQWIKNGTNIPGATDSIYTVSTLANNDTIRCRLTSSKICVTATTATSNNILMSVVGGHAGVDTVRLFGCNSLFYNGTVYTSSAVKTDTVQNFIGCDSIYHRAIITIRIINPVTRNLSLSGCNAGVLYQGITYDSSVVVRDTVRSFQGCDSIYTVATITVNYINPALSGPFNLIPFDNAVNVNNPVSFSWSYVPGATYYDLYVWPATDLPPANPVASNLTQIIFNYYGAFAYGVSYNWKVVARTNACITESAVQTFRVKDIPDLVVSHITVPALASSGHQVAISWQVKDSADAGTGNIPWVDHIWLSADDILQDNPPPTDFYLGGVANLTALLPGESYVNTAVFTLPDGIGGPYHIIVKPNALGTQAPVSSLIEKSVTNNTLVSDQFQIDLSPSPDLQVSAVTIPVNAFSGITVNVSWTVKNFGADIIAASAAWTDKIFLSLSPFFDPATDILLGRYEHTGNLQQDSFYTRSASVQIPPHIFGLYYIYFKTDADEQVYEVPFEGNNITSDVINVYLTPPPDLSAENLSVPATGGSGSPVAISWTVKNAGANVTDNSWEDKIFITTNGSYNLSDAVEIGSFNVTSVLASGDDYTKQAFVEIPNTYNGRYYLYLRTNAGNSLFENGSSQNNIIRSDTSIQVNSADLSVQSITAPDFASSGGSFSISATVKNTGLYPADKNWTDKAYISASPVFNVATATQIGETNHTGVNPGDSYNTQVNATVPANYNGNYYLYFYADAGNILFENGSELNNIRRSETPIAINSADLIVDSIYLPATVNSGEDISVSWRVKNQGTGDLLNATRVDSIYLSNQPSFNSNTAIRLKGVSFTESVSGGYTVTKQASVQVPNGLSGNYYLYLFTDARNLIFENGNENNNISRSILPVSITLSPSPNLTVQSIQVPDSARAGFKMPVSFTVKNTGGFESAGTGWVDKVYISPSPVWQAQNASLLGSFTRSQPLAKDSSYSINDSLLLRVSATGKLIVNGQLLDSSNAYLYVFTDADNHVYEYNAEDDNIIAGNSLFIIPPRIDLEVTYVYSSDSAYSGDTARAWWTVRNNGVSTAYKGVEVPCYWYDGVYLSEDSVWDAADIFVFDWGYSNTPKDSSYSDTKTFTIPNGLSGYYYLLLVADHKYNLHEDVNRSNNYALIREEDTGEPERIHIILSPSPDLVVTQASAPVNGRAGQPVKAKWSVKNNGLANAGPAGWEDAVYLSTDFNLDGNDILIGSKAHTNSLLTDQSYTDSMDITLPVTASGNYILIYKTDIHNDIYEYRADDNNTAYSLMTIVIPPPSDLVVTSINPPLTGIAGKQVTINYTIKNRGVNNAGGIMSDGVYLSRDTAWDIADQLIGTVRGNIDLDPGDLTVRSLTAQLTGASVGNYYVIVKSDLLNNIVETDDANNSSASNNSMLVDVLQLPLNVLTPDTLKNNNYLYYRIEIPDSLKTETLLVVLKGDSLNANNELYAKLGHVPNRAVYDFNQGIVYGGNQELLIPFLDSGTYYLAAYGINTADSNQHISLHASILPFAIRSVSANKGGNTGMVTIQLDGSKFEPNMQVRLDDGNGSIVVASAVYYINSTKLFASFNLADKRLGFYKVIAKKVANIEAVLDHGFEIIPGSGGGFYTGGDNNGLPVGPGCDPQAANGLNSTVQVDLQYPASTRRNRVIAITVFFGNSGNVDIPVPTRFVYSTAGAPLSRTVDGLSENHQELYLEFRENNGPPNILRPGATGAITFYTKAVAPLTFILSN